MRGDSETILSQVLDSMGNGVIAIDREGAIFVFNDAAARLLAVKKEDALGKSLLSIVPNSGLVNVLRTGEAETGRPQPVGARTVIANRAPIFRDGEMIGAVSVFQDVTEMEKMSRELDSTRALVGTLEEVLAGAGEWMVVVDAGGIVTMISEEYAEFNGTKVADAVGKHVTKVIENTRMHVVAKTGVAEIGERAMRRSSGVSTASSLSHRPTSWAAAGPVPVLHSTVSSWSRPSGAQTASTSVMRRSGPAVRQAPAWASFAPAAQRRQSLE